MRIKEIRYERLAKIGGQFENARIGVTIELDGSEGTLVPGGRLDKQIPPEQQAMIAAKEFVHLNLRLLGASSVELEDKSV